MEHFLIQPNEQGIVHAAKIIQTGGLVAFPTETVYGLGANALNEEAVKSIFTAKGRPLTDPLIVHIAEPEQSYELVDLSQDEMIVFQLLIARFWPGPLTVIVKSSSKIPLLVTANTGFVGVRCPKHPLAVSLLKASGLPIAAPSANRFGHVSPTTAAHVLADLGCKGVHVLNGEYGFEVGNDTQELISNCEYGIESSVVKIDLDSRQLIIFRQGAVNQQQLEHCLQSAKSRIGAWRVTAIQRAVKMSHTEVSAPTSSEGKTSSEEEQQEILAGQQAPGQAITHYAPDVPCYIVQKVTTVAVASGASIHEGVLPLPLKQLSSSELKSCAVLVDFHGAFGELRESSLAYRDLSVVGSSSEAARSLFDTLRWSEGVPGAKYVFIAAIPEIVSESASCAYRLREDGGDVRTDTSAGDAGAADMTLGLVDRIFRAASGVAVELVVWQTEPAVPTSSNNYAAQYSSWPLWLILRTYYLKCNGHPPFGALELDFHGIGITSKEGKLRPYIQSYWCSHFVFVGVKMSYNQKRFETPIELHRTLGNKYVVEVHQRKAMRKQIISELNAAAKANRHGHGVPTLNQYFDSAMFNKQLQLELELERLRASICEPVVSQEAGSEVSTVLESPPRNLSQPMQFTHVLPTIQNSKETPLKMTEPTIMNESTKIEPFYSPTPPNSVKIGKSSKTGQSTRNDFVGSAKVSTKTSKIDSSSNGVSTSSSKGLISQSAKVKKQPTEPTISEMEGVSSRSFGLNEEEQEIPETLEVVRSAPSNKSAKASRSARNVVSADGVSTKSRAPASAKITGQFSKATAPQLRTEEDDGFSTTEPTGAVISAPPTPAHEPVAPQWQPQQPMPQQEAQQLPSVSNDSDSASLVPMSPESFQALRIGSGISLRSGNDSAGLAQVPISSMASKPYTQQQYTPNTATAPGAMNVPFPLPTSAGAGSQMSFANTSLTGFGLGMTAYNNKYHQNSAAGGIGHSNINSNNSNMNLMNSWPHSAQSSTASYSPAAPTLPSGARLFPGVGPASYFPNKFHSEPTPPKEPKYNMFVLSSAPKVSFDSMVASEISHFQHAQAYSQYAPNIGMGMGGGLDSSIASEDLNQTGSVYKTEMSIQDQICRFAEIRSLFQMPSSTDIGDLHEQHSHQHRQQINLVEEAANAKLQESIDRHKQRLAKTRKSKPSPRSQIHKPKQPAYGAESDYFHNFETSQTPRGTISQVMPTFIPMPGTSASNCSSSSAATQGSAAGGSVVYQGAVPSMEGVSLVDSAPATAATIDRTISASVSTPLRAPLSPTTGENTTNSIPALTSATTTAPSSSASVRLSQVPSSTKQQSLPEDCSRGGTAAGGLSNGEDVGGPPGSAASSTAAAASAAVDGSNAPPATPAGVVPLTATISTAPPATAISSPVQIEPQMSIEEFQQKANKLDAEIRRMVPSVVQREILADAQSQHFTKRVRQQTLAKTKKPLAKKIEAKVEERLAELRKEIEMLRAAKVASPVKHGSDSEEESDDEEGEGEGEGRGEHEQHDDEHSGSWFKNNELKLKTKKRKKKSKAPKIDLDFSSISQEIKKSVENVILKHWKTHGGPMHLDDHEELLAASLKKIQEAAEEQDTVGFGAVTPKARSPKASDTPDKHGEHSPSSTAGVSGTHHPAAAAEVVVVEEEEAPKPKKLSKAERMLGITAEPPMLSTRTGAAVPEQSNKVGMLSSLGSMFGSKASVKPQDMQSPGSFHQPPAAASAGTVRFKGNKVSTLKPIADEEEEENSGRSAVTNTHVSGRSMKSVASMGQSQRHTSSRAESQRSMNVELAAAEIELRTANDRLAALNDTKSKLKKELKDWQKGFEARVGRPPNDADKSVIEDRFLAYQKVTTDVKDATNVVKLAEQKVDDLKTDGSMSVH